MCSIMFGDHASAAKPKAAAAPAGGAQKLAAVAAKTVPASGASLGNIFLIFSLLPCVAAAMLILYYCYCKNRELPIHAVKLKIVS